MHVMFRLVGGMHPPPPLNPPLFEAYTSLQKCSVLGLRTALFFGLLKMSQYHSPLLFRWNFTKNLQFSPRRLFFRRTLARCVLGPWPRAFLSLASKGSVLGEAVLGVGLGFFCVVGLEPGVLDSTSARLTDWYFFLNAVNENWKRLPASN